MPTDDTTIARPRPESSAKKMRRKRAVDDLITTLSENLVDAGALMENEVDDFEAIKRAMREVLEKINDVTAKNAV